MPYSDKTKLSAWPHSPSSGAAIPHGTVSPKAGWLGTLQEIKEWLDWLHDALLGATGHTHTGADGDGAQIPTGGIADSAVTTAKIANLNVTTAKIAAGTDGQVLTTSGASVAWAAPADKVYRIGHTYAITGEVKVPVSDTDYIIPFFVSLATGQTASLVKARYRINSGTSVTCKLQKNGVDVTGYTAVSVTTTTAETDAADVSLADNDMLALVVTAVSGTPKNMTFTIFIEYTQ